MMKKKRIYAAYGSNMNLDQMRKRCPNAELICTGTLKEFRLVFSGGGFANVEPDNESEVPVVVWQISASCEKSLDYYEGCPRLYIKEEVQIKSAIGVLTALIYVMQESRAALRQMPSKTYYEAIQAGYRANGLDTTYLEKALLIVKENQCHGGTD